MNFTLQILHASDLEGGLDAIENAPNFAAVVDALEAQAATNGDGSILLSAGDNYIPGPFFNAGGDGALTDTYEGFYNAFFGLIDTTALSVAADTNGDGFFDNDEIQAEIEAGAVTFEEVYTTDVNGDGSADYFEEIDASEGRIDIAIMNALGFAATAIGNHEFDAGNDIFENAVNYDSEEGNSLSTGRYGNVNFLQEVDTPGAQFAYLSANLDFSSDFDIGPLFTSEILTSDMFQSDLTSARDDLTDPSVRGEDSNDSKIAPATIVEVDGEPIGIVGATTQLVSTISSPGTVDDVSSPGTNDMVALAATLQPFVDDLIASGVNKVILVSHLQQFALEEELAGLLNGVDVIIAGGSDTLNADSQDRLRPGDTADREYPVIVEGGDGNPTAIVSTDGEYSYVGRLVIAFDENGNIIPDSIDENVSGAFATDDQGVLDVTGAATVEEAISASATATDVQNLTDQVTDVVLQLDGDVAGQSDVFLNGARSAVRTEETNFGNLTADANLVAAQAEGADVIVSIKNGGGIRASIGELVDNGDGTASTLPTAENPLSGKEAGEISELDIDNALRFDNGLVTVSLTPEELKIILEHGVAATTEGATPGQFPQVGGIRFSFDPEGTAQQVGSDGVVTVDGTRIQNVALIDENGNVTQAIIVDGAVAPDAPASIGVVTLNFLAGGGDGYPFSAFSEVTDLGIGEQEALSNFLTDNFPEDGAAAFDIADTDIASDTRIQNLSVREDTVFASDDAPALTFSIVAEFQGEGEDGDAEGASEVVAHEDGMLYVTNGTLGRVDIFDIATNEQAGFIDLTELDGFDGLQSVAVENGVVAVALSRATVEQNVFGGSVDLSQPGFVALFDAESGALLSTIDVGNLPDQLTFNADGTQLLVAGEGEKNDDSDNDDNPLGTVAVINTTDPSAPQATILDFTQFNGLEDLAREAGIRIQEGVSFAEDVEPEYIAISPDGTQAFVSLQENNAIAVIDLATNAVADIFSLGTVDFGSESQLDADDNGEINITNFDNLVGFRMADAIASFEIDGQTFIATANEGDSRDFDEDRVEDLADDGLLDESVDIEGLERLEVSTIDGDTDGDGDIDELHTFSSRSFSIFDAEGNLIFDSGPEFEQIIAELAPERFNDDDGDTDGDEDRSDAKGPEPEAIIVGQVGDATYAFIGLERDSGIMIYDISDPANASFVNYIPPAFVDTTEEGDVARHGPETIAFIPAEDSTTGNAQIAVAYEISGSTIVYDLNATGVIPDPEPTPEQGIVINEVLQSTTGTDIEFVELFGEGGASLEGLSLLAFNANSAEAGDINLRIDFGEGDVLGDNGFLLIGTETVAAEFGQTPDIIIADNTFENDSETFALVETDTLVVEDGTVINDPGTVVIDAVATVNGDLDVVDFFSAPQVGPDGSFLPAGVQRIEDGVDTDQADDFEVTDFDFVGDDNPRSTPMAGFADDDNGGDDTAVVAIYDIQGAGHVSPYNGQTVATAGIVTAVDFNGYYLQDANGDGNVATSDAIFVFVGNGNATGINVGDEVQVTGDVSEFIPGGAATGNLSITQISDSGAVTSTVLSSGNALPEATVLGVNGRAVPTEVVISDSELPVNLQTDPGVFNPDVDGIDFFESLEGMRVTIDDPVVIGATNQFDESYVVTDDGAFVTGGSPDGGLNDRGGLNLNADINGLGDLNPERIQLQYDAFFDLLPEGFDAPGLNIGDNLSDVTGVVSYSFGNFEVLVTDIFDVETPTSNTPEVTSIASGADELTVATYNVLNLTSAEADGDAAQIAQIASQIVNNLGTPDILALQEIQDNSGVADDGTLSADETLQALVDAIEAAGGPAYQFTSATVDEDGENGGVPGGNIRNAFLWLEDRVDLNQVVTLESDVLTDLGVSNSDAFEGTRDPLLGVFEFNGNEVTLINNHFSSRFGSDPIFGAVQPFNQGGEDAREAQALAINEVVDALLAVDPDANIAVLGDLNTFEFTDELSEDLPGVGEEQVLTNLIDTLETDDGTTFVFQGNSQALDHIFVTDGLLDDSEVDFVHVNNDFFDFASDHEPIVASFSLTDEPPVNLIVNGDFETHATLTRGPRGQERSWDLFNSIEGWEATRNFIELQDGRFGTGNVLGNTVLELDARRNATVEQTVDIVSDGLYELSFDFGSRGTNANNNAFEVLVNGEVVAELAPNQRAFQTETLYLDLFAEDDATIAFSATGNSNGIGGIIDNVSLIEVDQEDLISTFLGADEFTFV